MAEPIVAARINVMVCVGRLVLTLATTLLGRIDLDPFNLVIALAIAGAEAALIVLSFMHLWYSAAVMRVAAAAGLAWLDLLLVSVMVDFVTRAWLPVPGK